MSNNPLFSFFSKHLRSKYYQDKLHGTDIPPPLIDTPLELRSTISGALIWRGPANDSAGLQAALARFQKRNTPS